MGLVKVQMTARWEVSIPRELVDPLRLELQEEAVKALLSSEELGLEYGFVEPEELTVSARVSGAPLEGDPTFRLVATANREEAEALLRRLKAAYQVSPDGAMQLVLGSKQLGTMVRQLEDKIGTGVFDA